MRIFISIPYISSRRKQSSFSVFHNKVNEVNYQKRVKKNRANVE